MFCPLSIASSGKLLMKSRDEKSIAIGSKEDGVMGTCCISLFSRIASEPSRSSGFGGGGGGERFEAGSCIETFRRMAPTTRVACAASLEVCFLSAHILYDVPNAFNFLDRSAGL